MRELKFRVWDKYAGEKGIMYLNHTFQSIGETKLYNREHLVWMQYTGLKDKNGKEIYEGDVVNHTSIWGEKIGGSEVIFDDGAYCLRFFHYTTILPCLFEANDKFIEVIGNIYENPDLFEKGD